MWRRIVQLILTNIIKCMTWWHSDNYSNIFSIFSIYSISSCIYPLNPGPGVPTYELCPFYSTYPTQGHSESGRVGVGVVLGWRYPSCRSTKPTRTDPFTFTFIGNLDSLINLTQLTSNLCTRKPENLENPDDGLKIVWVHGLNPINEAYFLWRFYFIKRIMYCIFHMLQHCADTLCELWKQYYRCE